MSGDLIPTVMRVKAEQHESPAGMDFRGGLIATLRTSPGNHCLATFTGIDGATRDISPEVAERFAAAWNLCQGLPLEALKEFSKPGAGLAAALENVVEMAAVVAVAAGRYGQQSREESIDLVRRLIERSSPEQNQADTTTAPASMQRPRG